MSADRGVFVCQSQSLNLFFEKPDFKTLTASHFYGWKMGLKTGSYYIRSKPSTGAQRFSIDIDKELKMKASASNTKMVCDENECSIVEVEDNGLCESCSA